MYIKNLTDKNKMIIFLIFLIAFFIILTIWYSNKIVEEEKLVIAKNVKEIITINEINLGLYSENAIQDINPINTNNEIMRQISNLIYNGLFEYKEGVLEPRLIEDYAKIDEKNYVFKLKENIKFQNGEILTSTDVKNTIEKLFVNENSYYGHCVDNIQSIKIVDNTTFRINLIENEADFPNNLIFPILSETPNIGTNNYSVKEINNQKIVLENEKIGQILNIYIYDNLENLYGDFKNKKLDLIKSAEGIDYKSHIGEFGYQEKSYKGKNYIYLEFNTDRYFRDSRLKEATLAGINCEEIITKIFNQNAYNVNKIEYDLDRVVNILEEQNYIYKGNVWSYKGKNLNLEILLNKNLLTNLEIAYIIKEQLEKVGIKIQLVIVEPEEYYKKIELKEYDILISNAEKDFYLENEIENAIICNKLNLLYSSNLSGKIEPVNTNIFYNIDSWKKIL